MVIFHSYVKLPEGTPPIAIRLGSHLGVHLEAAGKAAAGHRFQLQLRGAEHLWERWQNGGFNPSMDWFKRKS